MYAALIVRLTRTDRFSRVATWQSAAPTGTLQIGPAPTLLLVDPEGGRYLFTHTNGARWTLTARLVWVASKVRTGFFSSI